MHSRIRLLFVCNDLAIGGIQKLLVTTASILKNSFFDITVCCIGGDGTLSTELEDLSVKVIKLSRKCKIYNIFITMDLFRIIRQINPQVVHTHSFYSNLHGRIAALFAGVPCIVASEHGTYSNRKGFRHRFLDYCLQFITDRIIAVSNAVKDFLIREEWIKKEKVDVIYDTIDFESVGSNNRVIARKKLGFSDTEILLGHLGTLTPLKGQDIAIQTIGLLRKDFPHIKLLLAGSDPIGYKAHLMNMVKELGIKDNVRFLGPVEDVDSFLSTLDIFLFPSVTEGFGLVLLEAAAKEVPIIAYAAEGITEIFADLPRSYLLSERTSAAFCVETLHVIQRMHEAKATARFIKKQLKVRFSTKVFQYKLENLYKDILSSKGFEFAPSESVLEPGQLINI